MNSIVQNLKIFDAYFQGTIDIDAVKKHLALYDNNTIGFEKDFYLVSINSSDEISSQVVDLLLSLNIDFNLWGQYLSANNTVYDLLIYLTKGNHSYIQLNPLIDLLDKIKQRKIITIAAKITLFSTTILLGLFVFFYSQVIPVISYLFITANFLPLFGILFSVFSAGIKLYLNHLDNRRKTSDYFRDDAFILIASAFQITGKILLITAPYSFIPLTISFLIAAATTDVIKEAFYLIKLYKNYSENPVFPENTLTVIRQQYARYIYDYKKQRNSLLINFISASLLSTVVIACCFIPSGVFLTITTSLAMATVFILNKSILAINEKIMRDNLQITLNRIRETSPQKKPNERSIHNFKQSVRSSNQELNYEQRISELVDDNEDIFCHNSQVDNPRGVRKVGSPGNGNKTLKNALQQPTDGSSFLFFNRRKPKFHYNLEDTNGNTLTTPGME